jgi:hypothetical protein
MAKINEIDITSLTFQEGTAPATPASTKWKIYTKTDGIYVIDDAGAETGPLGTGGSAATWQDYSPTWTSGGTSPSIGNGTLNGRYVRHGDTVIGWVHLEFGSTTTGGTSDWRFSAPLAVRDTGFINAMPGSAYFEDLATLGYRGQTFYRSSVADVFSVQVEGASTASATLLSTSNIFTFATGDYLTLHFTYETDAA